MNKLENLLDKKIIETLRLYSPDSHMHKLVGDKLRFIFQKLFRNTDINLDDFYFTVSADSKPNAFFISSEHTDDKKTNIICVTEGLIPKLQNIEQLAAIIAHESGHYVWNELLGGRNTLFQERAADVHSVDLMINAGYNPRYIISTLNLILNFSKINALSFDVHGSSKTRVSDVEAYITKISNERGVFDEIDDNKVSSEYNQFVTDVYNAKKKDDYSTYLESVIKKQFSTKDLNKILNDDLFKLFISELKNKNVNTEIRLQNLLDILKDIKFKKRANPDLIYDLVLEIINTASVLDFDLSYNLSDFIRKANIPSRGKFTELIKARAEFVDAVNSFDMESAAEFAKIIDSAGNLNKYVFDFSDFKYSEEQIKLQGEKNIGHMTPWEEASRSPDRLTRDIIIQRFGIKNIEKHNEQLLTKYAFENKEGKNIVVAYGQGIEEYNRRKIYEMYDYAARKQVDFIDDFLEKANLLARLGRGDISVEEYIKIVNKNKVFDKGYYYLDDINRFFNGNFKFIREFLEKNIDYKLYFDMASVDRYIDTEKNPKYPYRSAYIEDLFRKIKQSEFYNYFIKNDASDLFATEYYNEDNLKLMSAHDIERYISNIKNISRCNSLYEKYLQIFFKFIEYFKTQGDNYSAGLFANAILSEYTVYRDNFNPIDVSAFDKKINKEELQKKYNEVHSKETIKRSEIRAKIKRKAILELSHSQYCALHDIHELADAIENEFEYNNKSELLENILGVFDKKFPINMQELVNIIENNKLERFSMFFVAEYIRRGYGFNIQTFMKAKFSKVFYSRDCINHTLADWMTKNNIMNILPLSDKLELYECLLKNNLFYEKSANKNEFIKVIVDEIIRTNSVQYAENILMRANYLTGDVSDRKNEDLEFIIQREQLIDFVANHYAKQLGRDDKSKDFEYNAKKTAYYVSGVFGYGTERFSYSVAKSILEKISQKVVSQEKVARIFDDATVRKLNGGTVEKYDYYGRAVESIFELLSEKPEYAYAGIEFLNQKISDKSIAELNKKLETRISNNSYYQTMFSKQNLTIAHQNFWAADLEVRAYLMSRLLNAYSKDDNQKIDLVVDMFFDKKSTYYKDAKLVVGSLYNNLEDYERSLVLGAVTAASQRDENNNMTGGETIGRGLKMFFAAKGAAFIKFGQLLSYMPMLDSDIRKELSTMRDNAKVPSRMELINMINDTLPKTERDKISYVGKVLGAGSFFVSVQVTYEGKDAVIALKRPYTNELTESGMNLIGKTIDDLIKADSKYKPLKNIAKQAKLSAMSEIDIKTDYQKYRDAIKIYEGFTVQTPNAVYRPDVAQWYAYGESENGAHAYKIMEMASGESLISNTMSEQEKHDAAVAYVTLELSILLSGQKWDTDRHQGQQNFYNSSFRNFMVGIFDTGAQMDKKPKTFDKIMLGALLYSLVNTVRSGKSVSDVLIDSVKKLDNFADVLKQDTVYIDGVQRGLTALSDIMEYQKEIKDASGKVIQESRSLTTNDFVKIIGAIYKSGLVDKTVKRSVVASAVLDNIMPNKGLLKLLKMLDDKSTDDEIVVSYQEQDRRRKKSVFMGLSEQEISEKLKQKQADEHLGIKRGLTERKEQVIDVNKLAMGF